MPIQPSHSAVLAALLVVPLGTACVTRSAHVELRERHEAVTAERDVLVDRVARLEIERDALEDQFVDAQESYEDERVARETLARNLSSLQQEADTLDADLGAERIAHLAAAEALAAREAEIAAMQSTYDELVGDLESEVSAGQIEIQRLREGLRLNVSDDVLFASGSAELDALGREVLEKVAVQIAALDDFVEVRGHTDDRRIRGSLAKRFPTNWELAAARAARVVRLLEEGGVPSDRLAVVSLGPNDPVAPNDTADNRALNRRIEIRLLPAAERAAADALADSPAAAPRPATPAVSAPPPRDPAPSPATAPPPRVSAPPSPRRAPPAPEPLSAPLESAAAR